MSFAGEITSMIGSSTSSSSSSMHHIFVDPQISALLNPSTVQDINGGSHYCKETLNQYFHVTEPAAMNATSIVQKPYATHAAASGNLSLSLSSHDAANRSNLPLELNRQIYDSSMFSSGRNGVGYLGTADVCSTAVQLSRNLLPLGPFSGYASVLKGSKFLKPAYQLLEEICYAGKADGICGHNLEAKPSFLELPADSDLGGNGVAEDSLNCGGWGGKSRKKSRLLSMLDEVYKRYKHYYQQIQAVFSSFESVSGLRSATPFANLAVNTVSKHFKRLKNAITDQLLVANESPGKIADAGDASRRLEKLGRETYCQTSSHGTRFINQPVWKPQRGLPESAVTVLRAWLFEHFLHPYPTDTDKLMLAKQTRLSRNQVSNWFINARVRLWKPMVEEIHTLDTSQGQKAPPRREEKTVIGRMDECVPTSGSVECENASSTIQRISEFSLKRARTDLIYDTPRGNKGAMNLPFNNYLPNHPQLGVSIGGCSGVSLTLGLHQNGLGLSESYPINAGSHFDLNAHGEAYELNGFAAHNRHLGIDVVGGQLLDDFQVSNH